MKLWPALTALVLAASASLAVPVEAACVIGKVGELPITMKGFVPLVSAKVNGVDGLFEFDSGAFWSTLTPPAAARFGLKPEYAGTVVAGAGGLQTLHLTTAKELVFHGDTYHQVAFLTGPENVGANADGLLGQNALGGADVEYDLANGVIRLMYARDCDKAIMTYWVKPGQAISSIDIHWTTQERPHIIGSATLNGIPIRVMFDTGAARSSLSLQAAARAGVKPTDPGVTHGEGARGIAIDSKLETWIAPFASFKLGDEEIKNTRLRIGDFRMRNGGNLDEVDMLLGADFFLSHRVYVAKGQHKLYLTYNGGPVFRLDDGSQQPATTPAGDAPAPVASDAYSDAPTDASGFSRRAAASVARTDYVHAMADLNRAVEMAPTSPNYLFERGSLYLRMGRKAEARADFDQSVKLNPNYVDGLKAQVGMDILAKDTARARVDLVAADHAATIEPALRLFIAGAYGVIHDPTAGLAQYDLWIASHDGDPQMAIALYGRCGLRAFGNLDLQLALADCDAALRLMHHDERALLNRGLVYLRMGDYDHAISDFSVTLKAHPDYNWALYGRGLAHLRKGEKTQGDADLQAVAARSPHFVDEAKSYGLTP
jgi:tetratricopeptide (TPR) repeat protein